MFLLMNFRAKFIYQYINLLCELNSMFQKVDRSVVYPTTSLNLPLVRYAEILLFKAEALLMQGKTAEAAAPLNEVCARVGLSPIASLTIADLKHERHCELACE